MGNNSFADIVGIGDVFVQTNMGCTVILKVVRHVPDLRLNLISTHALDLDGYYNIFGGKEWKLTKGSIVVARGKLSYTLYKTQLKTVRGDLNAIEDDFSPDLWHRRLGHLSEKGLQVLAKKSNIPFTKGKYLNPCEDCLFGKQHRVSFSSSSERKRNLLELVYFDVCGPIDVPKPVDDTEQGEQTPPPTALVEPSLRRSERGLLPSTRYPSSNYVTITEEREPESFQGVQIHKDKAQWMKAMQEEMSSLKKNNTYELVELPKSRKPLNGCHRKSMFSRS
ncbi:hypothetical protein Sjap_009462 [Stephania japonica]|uniref:GAG-pre-integrase domain-containing protein n=1 Tax=Stephania japonica TaxID=461633 RepID=A0AAP0JRD1_9MAGN